MNVRAEREGRAGVPEPLTDGLDAVPLREQQRRMGVPNPVERELRRIMLKSFDDVRAEAKRKDLSYRNAAFNIAVQRIVDSMRVRGWVDNK